MVVVLAPFAACAEPDDPLVAWRAAAEDPRRVAGLADAVPRELRDEAAFVEALARAELGDADAEPMAALVERLPADALLFLPAAGWMAQAVWNQASDRSRSPGAILDETLRRHPGIDEADAWWRLLEVARAMAPDDERVWAEAATAARRDRTDEVPSYLSRLTELQTTRRRSCTWGLSKVLVDEIVSGGAWWSTPHHPDTEAYVRSTVWPWWTDEQAVNRATLADPAADELVRARARLRLGDLASVLAGAPGPERAEAACSELYLGELLVAPALHETDPARAEELLEASWPSAPLLDLPLGPEWAATWRTSIGDEVGARRWKHRQLVRGFDKAAGWERVFGVAGVDADPVLLVGDEGAPKEVLLRWNAGFVDEALADARAWSIAHPDARRDWLGFMEAVHALERGEPSAAVRSLEVVLDGGAPSMGRRAARLLAQLLVAQRPQLVAEGGPDLEPERAHLEATVVRAGADAPADLALWLARRFEARGDREGAIRWIPAEQERVLVGSPYGHCSMPITAWTPTFVVIAGDRRRPEVIPLAPWAHLEPCGEARAWVQDQRSAVAACVARAARGRRLEGWVLTGPDGTQSSEGLGSAGACIARLRSSGPAFTWSLHVRDLRRD